ncbi:TPA: DUF4070 domain-containing protein [Candidatus Poribacteria bacterium]|nr:DUF4070 domain-containing protein [Candidatus Poribacteria bacterium]
MRALLVYPECPDTFWSFKHALRFISKKAAYPPLGLLTVAAMLPEKWEKRLVDMNVSTLRDEDLRWADLVFISAMSIQEESVRRIIARCKGEGVKIVAGGPLFTIGYERFDDVDHLILGEAEITLPSFLEDLERGNAGHIYDADQWADMKRTPTPLWEILDMGKYASMSLQYSRGCPFNCEFCSVTALFGRKVRAKEKSQVLAELQKLYSLGWRGGVFFVDDNFIGNKGILKREVLPAIAEWMEERGYPFSFTTQVSINLSDDEELMRLMVRAGFDTVFVGIETPNEESLAECGKLQNTNRDLIACIRRIQKFGLQVQAGFIVGFDSDTPSIFERLVRFIQDSGIVTAMVGLLNAPRGTRLYQRLAEEGRLLKEITGDNTDFSINFVPKMDYEELIGGYKMVLNAIYSPERYYERVMTFLKGHNPSSRRRRRSQLRYSRLKAFLKSILRLGVVGRERVQYWKLILWCLFQRPSLLPMAVTFAIYGFHFRKIFEGYREG